MDSSPTRRAILTGGSLAGASATALTLGVGNAGAGSIQREVAASTPGSDDALSVRQFGAIGDGQFHALSTRFATLSAARQTYPGAVALTESLDGIAIQTAIDHAAVQARTLQIRRPVHIPAGRYRLSRSIRLPSSVILTGDGIDASIIDNQNSRLDAPLIVNDDPDVATLAVRDLSLHGGTHGIRLTVRQYIEGYELLRVAFQMQSDKNFECNRLLQLGSVIGCIFAKAPFGVYVGEWTTNAAAFHDCRFEDHARTALHLNGAECVSFFGGRFESGLGVRGPDPTIDLINAKAVNFHGVYFEGTPKLLLRERQSHDGVTFDGCHFTGSANPGAGPAPYHFDSDGVVGFGANDWGTPSPGPARMAIMGPNAGLVGPGRRYLARTPTDWHICSEQVTLTAGATQPVAVITRAGTGDGTVCITGSLTLVRMARARDGTVAVTTLACRLTATASGNRPIAVTLSPASAEATPIRMTARTDADGRARIFATMSDGAASTLRWTLEAQAIATSLDQRIAIDLS